LSTTLSFDPFSHSRAGDQKIGEKFFIPKEKINFKTIDKNNVKKNL